VSGQSGSDLRARRACQLTGAGDKLLSAMLIALHFAFGWLSSCIFMGNHWPGWNPSAQNYFFKLKGLTRLDEA